MDIAVSELREALRTVREHWGVGKYYDPETGCYCAAGAVAKAKGLLREDGEGEILDGETPVEMELEDALSAVLLPDYPESGVLVSEWNDDSTQAEVVAAFEAAIARLEG